MMREILRLQAAQDCVQRRLLLFAGDRVRYGQAQTTFGTTTGKHLAAIGGRHAGTETMLVDSLSVRRLKCSFHCRVLLCLFFISQFGVKIY